MKKKICSQCKGNGYLKSGSIETDCYYCSNQGEVTEPESFEGFRQEMTKLKKELSMANELRWFAEKDRDLLLQEYKTLKKEIRMLYDFLQMKGYNQKQINKREEVNG